MGVFNRDALVLEQSLKMVWTVVGDIQNGSDAHLPKLS